MRYVFFIEGPDAYDDSHKALVILISSLAESDSVKFCVPSRPWNHFAHPLGKHGCAVPPEDHMGVDSEQYVRDELYNGIRKEDLAVSPVEHRFDFRVEQLRDSVISNASWVFLWAVPCTPVPDLMASPIVTARPFCSEGRTKCPGGSWTTFGSCESGWKAHIDARLLMSCSLPLALIETPDIHWTNSPSFTSGHRTVNLTASNEKTSIAPRSG